MKLPFTDPSLEMPENTREAAKDKQKDYMNKCLQDIRAEVRAPPGDDARPLPRPADPRFPRNFAQFLF